MASPSPDHVARRAAILKYMVIQAFVVPPPLTEAFKGFPPSKQQEIRSALQQKTEELAQSFRRLGIWEFMTDAEVKFFSTNPLDLPVRELVNASWRLEALMVFLWALNIVPEIESFDLQAKSSLLEKVPVNLSDFIAGAALRDEESLEKKRELAELWHWRSRTRELIEKGVQPEGLNGRKLDDIVKMASAEAKKRGSLNDTIDEDFPAFGKAYRQLADEEWAHVRSIAIERHLALNWICGRAPDNDWAQTPTDT